MKRVVVTGLGVVAPNGVGVKEFGEAIFSGKSGIKSITSFDTSKSRIKFGGEVGDFDPIDYMPIHVVRKTDRFVHLGLAAAKMAIEQANLHLDLDRLQKACVIVGSGQGGLMFHEQTIINFIEKGGVGKTAASAVPRITSNAVSAYIALQYNIRGINQVISTACSSGAQAIGQAYRNIQLGVCELAVTGGVEAPLSPVMIEMYNSMMVLGSDPSDDPEKVSKPFDLNRNGFVISEGAGILVLESLDSAIARGAAIYAEVCGFGSNCGAYHMVTPNPTGEDAASAMNEALSDAALNPCDINYINAHGTSTKWNDLSETKAIKIVFDREAANIPISSIKSMTGHTIGGAGALEAVASCLTLINNIIPPTINLNTPDPECDLDYVANEARQVKVNVVMSNSFGFGSNNAVLIFRRI